MTTTSATSTSRASTASPTSSAIVVPLSRNESCDGAAAAVDGVASG